MSSKARAAGISVVGSGLAGPLLAIQLAERGIPVDVYERRADIRKIRVSAGRSINLALSARGIRALEGAGLWESMGKIAVPMRGRRMHSVSGDTTFQPYGKDESEMIHSISRADLNIALMDAAEAHGIDIQFSERCTGVDGAKPEVHLHNEMTGQERSVRSDAVIATDGATSAVRLEMLKSGRFDYSQQYLEYGYKELTIPAGSRGEYVLEPNALHIWPRGAYMLIALPNIDGSFACILFLPYAGSESFGVLDSRERVKEFFEQRFPDAAAVMPDLADEFFENPTGSMVTIRCFPWVMQDRTLLLGDSAHAIVPFFGQGLNCAFEDCTWLIDLFEQHGPDWPQIFRRFQQVRKPNTDAIAEMALDNFIEMRDRVADPHFLFMKRVELALESQFPRCFVPKYSMVSFHHIPYAIAESRGRVQSRILAELCASASSIEDIDWTRAGRMIAAELTPLEYV